VECLVYQLHAELVTGNKFSGVIKETSHSLTMGGSPALVVQVKVAVPPEVAFVGAFIVKVETKGTASARRLASKGPKPGGQLAISTAQPEVGLLT
jgi:hypothetical protein